MSRYIVSKGRILQGASGMKKNVLLLTFCCIAYRIGTESPIAISLGQECSTAAALRGLHIRTFAYPFDWIISPFNGLYDAFATKFVHFLEKDSLCLREDKQGIVDYYHFQFVHDFPTLQSGQSVVHTEEPISQHIIRPDFLNFYDVVKEKYTRRITRLINILQGTQPVILIRHFDMNREQVQDFYQLIHTLFPELPCTLAVVQNAPEAEWGLPGIRNFFLDNSKIWNDAEQWIRILKELGLEPSAVKMDEKYEEDDFCCHEWHK
jgi:hypothetical protein